MNLFDASWSLAKHDINKHFEDFKVAVSNDDEQSAVDCYNNIVDVYENLPISVASFFQKIGVNNHKKKILKSMETAFAKKGWD